LFLQTLLPEKRPLRRLRIPEPRAVLGNSALWDNVFLKGLIDVGVPKKACHGDKQLPEKKGNFFGILLKIADVVFKAVKLMLGHPAFYPPADRGWFVSRKVVAGL
jgi:hypothetical protein